MCFQNKITDGTVISRKKKGVIVHQLHTLQDQGEYTHSQSCQQKLCKGLCQVQVSFAITRGQN